MAEIKRLNYFDYQFLKQQDFNDEQGYHIGMRRRHNQYLHTWGIMDGGFHVDKVTGNPQQVTVGPGMAIDNQGREIILLTTTPALTLSQLSSPPLPAGGGVVFLTVRYDQVKDDSDKYVSTDGMVTGYTRWTERPAFQVVTAMPTDGSAIPLAKITVDASGSITGNIDLSVQPVAGSDVSPTSSLQVNSLAIGPASTNPGLKFSLNAGLVTTHAANISSSFPSGDVWMNQLALQGSTVNGEARLGFATTLADGSGAHTAIIKTVVSANGGGDLVIQTREPNFVGITERVRVTNIGNVGIGTQAPNNKLEILQGNAKVEGEGFGFVVDTGAANRRVGFMKYGNYEGALVAGNGTLLRLGHRTDTNDVTAPMGAFRPELVLDPSGNVGIGTTAPGFLLDVAGRTRIRQGPAGDVDTGGIWFYQNRPKADQAFVGMVNDTAIGFFGNTGAGWGLQMNTTNGYVGIGTVAPTQKLHVQGQFLLVSGAGNELCYLGGDGAGGDVQLGSLNASVTTIALWNAAAGKLMNVAAANVASDERFKSNVQELDRVLEKIKRLRGVSFEWKQDAPVSRSEHAREIGLIAQEVQSVFPELVTTMPRGNYLSLEYGRLTAVLVEAIKELDAKVDTLGQKLDGVAKQAGVAVASEPKTETANGTAETEKKSAGGAGKK